MFEATMPLSCYSNYCTFLKIALAFDDSLVWDSVLQSYQLEVSYHKEQP